MIAIISEISDNPALEAPVKTIGFGLMIVAFAIGSAAQGCARAADSGCFGSSNCAPCAAAPVNGTSICTVNGACDFTCGGAYVKNGNACGCGSAVCCADSDCGGNGSTCVGGSCTVPATCDGAQCLTSCLAYCLFTKGTPGIGLCLGNNCLCTCG